MDMEVSISPITVNLNWMARLRGLFAVIVAYTALHCLSLSSISKILIFFKNRCSREIGIEEAEIAWAAVRQYSFFFSGRVACLELSLGFVIFALIRGLSATWCVGVATEPFRAHAWVEIDGKIFREADKFEQHFRKMLSV